MVKKKMEDNYSCTWYLARDGNKAPTDAAPGLVTPPGLHSYCGYKKTPCTYTYSTCKGAAERDKA